VTGDLFDGRQRLVQDSDLVGSPHVLERDRARLKVTATKIDKAGILR